MKIHIEGSGSFGSFLKELLPLVGFELDYYAESVILAVPISAYKEVGEKFAGRHLINVCSVQKPSTDILLKITNKVTSIHPLFGKRTPADKRNSILTYECKNKLEEEFLSKFTKLSKVWCCDNNKISFTPELHDKLMFKTHYQALLAAKLIKPLITDVSDIPDELIPNSFRLLRQFSQTLEDMPVGTISSILANPYAEKDKI